MKKKIYIYGAGGHGLVVADIARACGYEEIIFVDDEKNAYLSFESIKNNTNIPIALGIGKNAIREKIFNKILQDGFEIVTLIHPSAIVSSSAMVEAGVVIMPNVAVNAKASIGKGAILNTACVVEHECSVNEFVHISPNVALAGNVNIKKGTHIGIGSSIVQGVVIGENCIIGAGSTVIRSIGDGKLCYGNPCRKIKELH